MQNLLERKKKPSQMPCVENDDFLTGIQTCMEWTKKQTEEHFQAEVQKASRELITRNNFSEELYVQL